MRNKGFTLIELIMVIVILGVLASIAVPKYIDMRRDAADAAANSVLGSLNAAGSAAFAKFVINPTANGAYNIDTPAKLIAQMDHNDGLSVSGTNINYTVGGFTYVMSFTAADSTRSPAKVSKTAEWPRQ